MRQFIVNPLVGFDNVQFGMSREEVRSILGSPLREFKKSKYSKTTTDDFGVFHVFYDETDKFEAVEFFEEAGLKDIKGNTFPKEITADVPFPYALYNEGNDYINAEYSIGIFAPNNRIESILFGIKGYY